MRFQRASFHGICYEINEKDIYTGANLKKVPKLIYVAVNPGNHKQNVSLALSVIDETTLAAIKSYCAEKT